MQPKAWWVLLGLIGMHFVVDLLTSEAIQRGPPPSVVALTLVGIVISQVNLIAMWAVFAQGPVIWRMSWAALLGVWMWYVLVIGNRWSSDGFSRADAYLLGSILLGGIVVAQPALWVLRSMFGYRLTWPARAQNAEQDQQYNLRQMLLGTTAICVTLGLAPLILPVAEKVNMPHWEPQMFIVLSIATVVNLCCTLPACWIAFARRPLTIALLVGAMLLYTAGLTVIEFTALGILLGPGPQEATLHIFALNLAQFASVAISLGVLRWVGYRFQLGTVVIDDVPAMPLEMPSSVNDNPPQLPPAVDPLRN